MRTTDLRNALIAIQDAESHHKLIGSMRNGYRVPLDAVCRECPSRKKCYAAGRALADLETSIF